MQQTVRDWMKDLIVYVDPETKVTDALATMRRRYVTSLIVKKSNTNPDWGIVTAIDICDKIVARGADPAQLTVGQIMNSPLITVSQDMLISECAALMKEKRIHHLPVVNGEENFVGMISAGDFLVIAEVMGRGTGERMLS